MALKKLRGKKALFIEAWVKTFGNITTTCRAIKINRSTYYDWMENDPIFKLHVEGENVQEAQKDMIESKLNKLAVEEDKTVLIFLAKTKCKDRGYVERLDHDHTTKGESMNQNFAGMTTEEIIERAKAARELDA